MTESLWPLVPLPLGDTGPNAPLLDEDEDDEEDEDEDEELDCEDEVLLLDDVDELLPLLV